LSQLQKFQDLFASNSNSSNIVNKREQDQATLDSVNTSLTSTSDQSVNTSIHHFGTLLLVLVLFVAVVLGVWSPVYTKEHNAVSQVASETYKTNPSTVSSTERSMGPRTSTMPSSVTLTKHEIASSPVDKAFDVVESVKTIDSHSYSDELNEMDSAQNANNIVRSKTGTTVELTKVRPFIRKMQSSATGSANSSEPMLMLNGSNSAEEGQIIILNLNSQSNNALNKANVDCLVKSTSTLKTNVYSAASESSKKSLGSNLRVINTASNLAPINGSSLFHFSPSKMPKFRIINNPSTAISTNPNDVKEHTVTLNPSVIKFNSA
jgi:hypothetical protein